MTYHNCCTEPTIAVTYCMFLPVAVTKNCRHVILILIQHNARNC